MADNVGNKEAKEYGIIDTTMEQRNSDDNPTISQNNGKRDNFKVLILWQITR